MTNRFLYPNVWQALVLLAVVVGLQFLVSIPFHLLGWIKHPAVLALLGVLSFTPALDLFRPARPRRRIPSHPCA